MLKNKIIKDIHKLVFSNFTYITDKKQYNNIEKWVQPASDYDGTTSFKGDCEDFALACRKLLRDANIESRLVYCTVENGEGHLVLSVDGWILDNRFRAIKTNSYLVKHGYTFIKISGLNSGDPWHKLN